MMIDPTQTPNLDALLDYIDAAAGSLSGAARRVLERARMELEVLKAAADPIHQDAAEADAILRVLRGEVRD